MKRIWICILYDDQIYTHNCHYTKMMRYICIKFHGLNLVRMVTHIQKSKDVDVCWCLVTHNLRIVDVLWWVKRDKIHHTLGRSSRSRSVMYETCAPSFSKHVVCKSFDVKISYRRRGNVMQIYTTSNFSIFGGLGDFGWMSNNHKRNDMEWLITVYIQYATFHHIFQHIVLRGVYV